MEDILKNDEQNVNLSKTYKLTYNAGKCRLEFTIDNIDSSSEIMTEFKDGAMKALAEQKDVALDLSKIDLANVTSIRLNNTPADVKTWVTAKTGTVTLEMLFKTSEAATKVKKIYLVQNGQKKELTHFPSYFEVVENNVNSYNWGAKTSRYSWKILRHDNRKNQLI